MWDGTSSLPISLPSQLWDCTGSLFMPPPPAPFTLLSNIWPLSAEIEYRLQRFTLSTAKLVGWWWLLLVSRNYTESNLPVAWSVTLPCPVAPRAAKCCWNRPTGRAIVACAAAPVCNRKQREIKSIKLKVCSDAFFFFFFNTENSRVCLRWKINVLQWPDSTKQMKQPSLKTMSECCFYYYYYYFALATTWQSTPLKQFAYGNMCATCQMLHKELLIHS